MSAALLLALPGAAAGDPVVNDISVGAAVRDELAEEPSVPLAKLVVSANDGVVTLAGAVDNLLARERATRVAETVKGVRTVINRIRVEPAARLDDTDLLGKVEFKLAADAATDSYQIVTSVSDGEVGSIGERDAALHNAWEAGAISVCDRLEIVGG